MLRRASKGFTLIELLTVVALIAILASIARPIYNNYVDLAKATSMLSRIHSISMNYLDTSYDVNTINTANNSPYDSEKFGIAPAAFAGMDKLYKTNDGHLLASYVLDQSGFFNSIIKQSTPVIFIKANNSNDPVLHMLNDILKQKHVFVTPSILAITLSNRTPTLLHSSNQTPMIQHIPATPDPSKQGTPDLAPTLAPTQIPNATPMSQQDCQPHQHYAANQQRCNNVCNPGTYFDPVAKNCSSTPPKIPMAVPVLAPTLAPTQIPTLAPPKIPMATPSMVPTLAPTQKPDLVVPDSTNTAASQIVAPGQSNTGSSAPLIPHVSPPTSQPHQIPARCYRHPGWLKNHLHGC